MLQPKKENRLSSVDHEKAAEINVLLVEDSESDAYTVQRILANHMPGSCNITHVTTIQEAELTLSSRLDIDIVLLDLGLPDSSDSEESYSRLEEFKHHVPIVVLTGVEDNELAMGILGYGAQDYVCKNFVSREPETLCRNIQFAIGRHRNMSQTRRKMDDALAEKETLINMMNGGYSVMQ